MILIIYHHHPHFYYVIADVVSIANTFRYINVTFWRCRVTASQKGFATDFAAPTRARGNAPAPAPAAAGPPSPSDANVSEEGVAATFAENGRRVLPRFQLNAGQDAYMSEGFLGDMMGVFLVHK